MRLHSLKIRNFRVLRKIDLEFGDNVIGIIGNNGTGKSSIIESIAWALYGQQASRSARDEIKSNFAAADDNCEVILDFSVNGEDYRIIRRLIGKQERPEMQLYRGEIAESIGVSETQNYVRELLGLDWKGFLTSFFARQQELNALSDLQPARRKDHLAGMLGIERLDKVIVRVKDDARLDREKAELLTGQLSEGNQIESRIAELSRKKVDIANAVRRLTEQKKQAESDVRDVTKKYTNLQEARSVWSQLTARIEATEKSRDELRRRNQNLHHESDNLEQQAVEADTLKRKVTDLPPLRKQLDDMKTTRNRLEFRQQLEGQSDDLTSEHKQVKSSLTSIEADLRRLAEELAGIPDNIKEQLANSNEKLDEAREHYTSCRGGKETLSSEITKLTRQMNQITQFGPESVCDRCLRPLGNDLPVIKQHLTDEMDQLHGKEKEIINRLDILKSQGTHLKEETTQLDSILTKREKLQVKQEEASKQKVSLDQRRKDINKKLTDINKQLEQTKPVEFDDKKLNLIVEQITSLEKSEAHLNQLLGSLARRPKVKQELDEISTKLVDIDNEASSLTTEREKLDFSEKEFEVSKNMFNTAQEKLKAVQDEYVTGSTELKVTTKDLERQLEQLENLEKIRKQVDDLRSSQYYEQKLAGLFKEFREHLVSRIRPTLADFSSRLISEMTNGRYSMVELDEKYNLRLLDANQYFGIDRFSGGEKELANLCLRLAISLTLTESAKLTRPFIILDEVFGSQDTNRKELILNALRNLKQRFPQIFLITHVEDIRDQVETLIEVTQENNSWSKVEIHGQN
ncbi:MAG: SMC family ATPase [candidate division Zixibacteria bacterium]|nr:SMC family ATPase [candidate division Zixibacteria bacterium]